jgi:predicted alpha/beta-fold hydrolase
MLVVIHGVGGNHEAREGVSLGRHWQWTHLGSVLLVSLRGAFRTPLRPRLYHAGCSEELDAIYLWAQALARQANQKVVMVGFSLGANIVVKWLAETRHILSQLAGAFSLSNPWDLQACCQHLEQSWSGRCYRAVMVRTLKQRGLGLASRYPDRLNSQQIAASRTFLDYDSAVTAPLHGFDSAAEYYRQCSSAQFVGRVQAPLVCLDALDDPFVPNRSLPLQGAPGVRFVRPQHGGHLGFVGLKGQLWMEEFICRSAADWISRS